MKKRVQFLCGLAILSVMAACGKQNPALDPNTSNAATIDLPAQTTEIGEGTVSESDSAKPEDGEKSIKQDEEAEAQESGSAEAEVQETGSVGAEVQETGSVEASGQSSGGIDVDLAALSGTMVYAEVYHMLTEPEQYIGKTVRMSGQCNVYYDEVTDKTYYSCIIKDATACCAQGIEFELADGYDIPEEGDEICVEGVFDIYLEGENSYCTLRNAKLDNL